MKPVAAIVLYSFNEERFIRESVASILAQTYSPLEIVLSDDGSSDRTYAIMEEMANAYRGPHRIILNRNPANIGIGSQLNAGWQKSRGELILLANGDDVSLPKRVERTVTAWEQSGRRAKAITTDLLRIDASGNPLPGLLRTHTNAPTLEAGVRARFGGVGAASLAVTRDVFDRFGPLMPRLILEDNALFMRAYLLGETLHLNEPLVRYRVHPDNISQNYAAADFSAWVTRFRGKAGWQPREAFKAYLQMISDLYAEPVASWPVRDLKRARWAALEMLLRNAILRDYHDGEPAMTRGEQWRILGRTAALLAKTALKSRFPWIERRNERWHYRQLQERDRGGWQ